MGVITINAKNFIAGESTTGYIADKGFSPDSYALNLIKLRGLMYFAPSATTRGSGVILDSIIASCPDTINSTGINAAYLLDRDGNFYTYSGTTLTNKQTSGHTYTLHTSALVPHSGYVYASSEYAVAQLTASLATLYDEWWTGLSTSYRHPMETVEDELFIADGDVIYYWNGTSSGTAFTLPHNVNITTLRKHPNGVDLLAMGGTSRQYDHSGNGAGKIYVCDPQIRDWKREIDTETQIEGSYLLGGVVYVTYGSKVGYFNGDGVSFLKQLATSTFRYSNNMNAFEDNLLVGDGREILMFGDVGAGKVWSSIFRNSEYSTEIENICYIGGNTVLASFRDSGTVGQLREMDYDTPSTLGIFYTNKIDFEGEAIVTRIDIIHEVSAANNAKFGLSSVDADGSEYAINDTAVTVPVGGTRTRIQCNIRTDVFQLKIVPYNEALGIKSIRIYYDKIK